MEVVVAMRLHALIFAASRGKPLVGISYNEKVSSFLEYIGQNLSTPLSELTSDKLKRDIATAVSLIPNRESRLEAVEVLRRKERLNREVLARMLMIER